MTSLKIILMFSSSSRDKFTLVAKLRDRCFCWLPAAMLVPICMSMVSLHIPHKKNCHDLNHGESLCIIIYLHSFPRFWTLFIERIWFLFWSSLNGLNTSEVDFVHLAWFNHLGESFSYKKVQLKTFCPTAKTSCPPADNVHETLAS